MKVLFLASEVAGLIKTGGLADVAKSLPAQLKANGHDVRIVMPCYSVVKGAFDKKIIGTGTLNPGSSLQMDYAIRQTFTSDGVEVWMLDYRRYYGHYAQRVGHQIPDRHLADPLGVARPRLQAHDMGMLQETQLGGNLDGD